MTAWRWSRLDQPGPAGSTPAGGWASRVVAVAGDRPHLVANAGDGSVVGHFRLEAAGLLRGPDLPLRRASSAAATADRFAVAGVAPGTDRPGVCVTGGVSGPDLLLLDAVAPSGGAAPLAAWPVLAADADGSRVWVVWAEGGSSPAVHTAVLADDRLSLAGSADAAGVLGVQAAAAPGGGVEVLWQTAGGSVGRHLELRRGRGPAWSPLTGSEQQPAPPAAAVLGAGAVVWPAGPRTVRVWDTRTGARRDVPLPATPEGGDTRVVAATRTRAAGADLLVWTTRSRTGEPTLDRCWVAALPAEEDPDGAEAAPAGVRQVLGVGQRLVGWPGDGAPLAWLGTG